MKAIISIVLLLTSSFSFAEETSSESRLRKVSYLLRGHQPSVDENDEIANLIDLKDKDIFIEKKVDDFLSEEAFTDKMMERLDELFRVRIKNYRGRNYGIDQSKGSLDLLFKELIEDNGSWDKLLTETEYKILDTSVDSDDFSEDPRGLSEGAFYAYNASTPGFVQEIQEYLDSVEKEESSDKDITPYTYTPSTDDQRDSLAGALTTNRFYSRYPTTRLNKNRKRAAAIFRIFLCDSMTPVVLSSDEDDRDLLNLSLGGGAVQDHGTADAEARHGSDPQCNSCHYKLDPAANTFIGAGAFPNKRPSPGALVYKRDDGSLLNIPVNGIGELGVAITQQPEYLQCQVQHFWNWFIGSDIPLGQQKKEELASKFNDLGRRPKDFIKHLLNSSDFISPKTLDADDIRFSHVKPILQRCDSCHINEVGAPILGAKYPYSDTSGFNDFTLSMMVWAANLKEHEQKVYMPPKNAGWKLEGLDRDLVKAWIRGGAKDDSGSSHIGEGTTFAKSVEEIPLEGHIENLKRPGFGYLHNRYINNYDFFRSLEFIIKKVEGSQDQAYDSGGCYFDEKDQSTFGFNITATGIPLFVKPSQSLIDLINTCIDDSLRISYKTAEELNWLLTPEVLDRHERQWVKDIKWFQYSESIRLNQIKEIVTYLVGKNVLSDGELLEISLRITEAIKPLENKVMLDEVIRLTFKAVVTSPEFLVY